MSQKRRTAGDEPFFLIRSLAAEFESGQAIERHAHDWGQLIYASAGVTTVWTQAGSWVAPGYWAIWVPAGVRHSIRFAGSSSLRTLYLRPALAAQLPTQCAAMVVSPLLRELIARTVAVGMLDEREEEHRALALLIVGEFQRNEAPPYDLPGPVSHEARHAAALLQSEELSAAPTSEIAREVGLSVRTLERRFFAETGMSLGRWRRQSRLQQALRHLALGQSTKAVACAAGYRTPSAFVAAFRKTFGATPGRYFGREQLVGSPAP
jgi:AraC-like DNA-binding protein